jgi:hypothetical protein
MYKRKTTDIWEIQGYYCQPYGFETVCTETSRKAAREQFKCYNENEPHTPHRIIKKRERIEVTQ